MEHHRFDMKLAYFLRNEITELYLTHALKSFAMSTISIFIPIFFLTKGYAVQEVLLYYAIYVTLGTVLQYVALKYASMKGAKHAIVLSIPFLLLFFLSLYYIDIIFLEIGYLGVIFLISFLGSLSGATYYAGFHIDFAKSSERKKSAKQVGIIDGLGIIFSILGPLIGAMIISIYSFNVLFIMIMILLFISVVPLYFSKDVHESFNFEFNNELSKEEMKKNWVFFAEGLHDYATRIFWPVLLFLFAINIKEIGGLFTFSNAILALFTIYIGKKITGDNRSKIMTSGAVIHSLTIIVRTFFRTVMPIAITQGVGAQSFSMLSIPFQSSFYRLANKDGIIKTIFAREIYLHFGRLCIVLVIAFTMIFLPATVAIIVALFFGSIASLWMSRIGDY